MEETGSRLDFKLCLVCQSKREPRSTCEPLLHIRADHALEVKYVEIWSLLKKVSAEKLEAEETTWHRKCYQDAPHSGMLKTARERYEKLLESGKKEIARICFIDIIHIRKDIYFFCDEDPSYVAPRRNRTFRK